MTSEKINSQIKELITHKIQYYDGYEQEVLYKWNKRSGQDRELTFRFMNPDYSSSTYTYNYKNDQMYDMYLDFTKLTSFTPEQIELTRSVLNQIAHETGLEFRQVDSNQDADINFGNGFSDVEGSPAAFAFYPDENIRQSRNIWVNSKYIDQSDTSIPHEIGHALGLNHAHNNNESVMGGGDGGGKLLPIDILALQKLYGTDGKGQKLSDRNNTQGGHLGSEFYSADNSISQHRNGTDNKNQIIKLVGQNDKQIGTITVDAARDMVTINITEQNPHSDFPDKYAAIRIMDGKGNNIFDHEITGINNMLLDWEIPITSDITLAIYHAESEKQRIFSGISNTVHRGVSLNIYPLSALGIEKKTETIINSSRHDNIIVAGVNKNNHHESRDVSGGTEPCNSAIAKNRDLPTQDRENKQICLTENELTKLINKILQNRKCNNTDEEHREHNPTGLLAQSMNSFSVPETACTAENKRCGSENSNYFTSSNPGTQNLNYVNYY